MDPYPRVFPTPSMWRGAQGREISLCLRTVFSKKKHALKGYDRPTSAWRRQTHREDWGGENEILVQVKERDILLVQRGHKLGVHYSPEDGWIEKDRTKTTTDLSTHRIWAVSALSSTRKKSPMTYKLKAKETMSKILSKKWSDLTQRCQAGWRSELLW